MSIFKLYFIFAFNKKPLDKDFHDREKFYKFSSILKKHKEDLDYDKQLFLTEKLFPKLIYIPILNFIYLIIFKRNIYTSFKSAYSKFWFWRNWSGLVFVNCLIVGSIICSIVFLWMGITNFNDSKALWFALIPILLLFACFFSFIFPWVLRIKYNNTSVFDNFIINCIYFPLIYILIKPENKYLKNINKDLCTIVIANKEFNDILNLIDWIFELSQDEFISIFNNKEFEWRTNAKKI